MRQSVLPWYFRDEYGQDWLALMAVASYSCTDFSVVQEQGPVPSTKLRDTLQQGTWHTAGGGVCVN